MSITDNAAGGVDKPEENAQLSESQNDSQGGAEAQNTGDATTSEAAGAETENSASEKSQGFANLGLPDAIQNSVAKVGFTEPSPIQAETIPLLMDGRDVVGLAQTGTGKTAAFALPILARIASDQRHPQALVLAPTRELALQVADSFQSFAEHLEGIEILPIYGGQAYGIQLSGLRRGAQIIVGTPGRVIDHLDKGSLDISQLDYMVLDEADEMLNMGFQEDVERILDDTPEHKQVALFSATMPNGIRRLSKKYLDNPAEVTVKAQARTNDNITQRYIMIPHRAKMAAFIRILKVIDYDAVIVFCRTKQETEEVAEKLGDRGFNAAAINGDIAQNQRERTVDQLKDGRLDILVATDVAARGLDVDRITHVINYDIPRDTESYVHRIGRTGRAGRTGEAILFVTPRERRMLRSIERVTKARLEEMDLPTVAEVNDKRTEKFQQRITAALGDKQVEFFRKLVRDYSEENDTAMDDIAAAIAVMMQDGKDFLMKDEPLPKADKKERKARDRGPRGGKDRGGRAHHSDPNFETYRLDVGKRQNVRPGAIVGAIANEGGLTAKDFGRITIAVGHTLVDLPKNLDPAVLERLKNTRISGQLINIQKDTGRPPRRSGKDGRPGDARRGDARRGGGYKGKGSGHGRGRGAGFKKN